MTVVGVLVFGGLAAYSLARLEATRREFFYDLHVGRLNLTCVALFGAALFFVELDWVDQHSALAWC